MAFTTQSPNMNLQIPVVSQDPGPQYATDLNACFTVIDAHDHSVGNGVQVTPAGINVNSDFPINNNDIITARSLRFTPQTVALSDPTDIGCLYEVSADLYYNDGSGNQVRITQSGAVAGTPGSIANLVSPASATYVGADQTFVWQSDVNTAANLDAGFIILRNATASSFGLTLQAPALSSNYTITLPSLPASQKFVSLDNGGNMGAAWAVDNSTIEVSSNIVQVKASGIGTTQLADGAVTKPKLAALGQQISSDSGGFTTTSTSYVDVTNLSIVITTTGRPVMVAIIPGGTTDSNIGIARNNQAASAKLQILRDSTSIGISVMSTNFNSSITVQTNNFGVGCMGPVIDVVAAGTYTYKVQAIVAAGSSISVGNCKLVVFEL